MNSFQELNFYSNTEIAYIDPAPMTITFSANTATNQVYSIAEDQIHYVLPGINIVTLTSANNVSYSVNVANVAGATVTWPNALPQFATVSNASGVYTVSNIGGVSAWNAVKSPYVTMPLDFANNWVYTATISYANSMGGSANTISWLNTVFVTDTAEITLPVGYTYDENSTFTVSGYPQIVDTANVDPGATYTIAVYPSNLLAVNTLSSSGNAVVNTFNANTKTLTISGTYAQVNNNLSNVTLKSGRNFESNYLLNYSLINPSNVVTITEQIATIGNSFSGFTAISAAIYDEDTAFSPASYPQIDSADGNFVVTIYPNTISAITSISSTGNLVFNNTTKTASIYGSRDTVNASLGNLTITPGKDFVNPFSLTYDRLDTIDSITVQRTQEYTVGNIDLEISANISNTRYYTENGYDLLFPNATPAILETVSGASYEMRLTTVGNVGVIAGLDGNIAPPDYWNYSTNTFTYSGGKDAINTQFAALRFLPNKNQTGNVYVNYSQYRNSELQPTANANILVVGTALGSIISGNTSGTVNEDTTFNVNWNYYPNFRDTYAIVLKTQRANVDVNDVGYINSSGWTTIGNVDYASGIYKQFTPPLTVQQYSNDISELSLDQVSIQLKPDYTTDFVVKKQIGIESTYNGTIFSGGTVYTAADTIDVVPVANYSLTTDYNYAEDGKITILQDITDTDPTANIVYTVNFANWGTGRFIANGVPGFFGANLLVTNTKANISSTTFEYQPPFDSNDLIKLGYYQSKVVGNTTIQQASNVQMTLTCTVTNTELQYPVSISAIRYNNNSLSLFQITDSEVSPGEKTYTFNISQSSNIGTFYNNGVSAGNTVTFSGTKANVNAALSNSTTYWTSEQAATTIFTSVVTRTSPNSEIIGSGITNVTSSPPVVGTTWQGGIYYGIQDGYYKIVQSAGPAYLRWVNIVYASQRPDVTSNSNGTSNTSYLTSLGSDNFAAAHYAENLVSGGFSDWYLPAIDELTPITSANIKYNAPGGPSSGYFYSSTVRADQLVNRRQIYFPFNNSSQTFYDNVNWIDFGTAPSVRGVVAVRKRAV